MQPQDPPALHHFAAVADLIDQPALLLCTRGVIRHANPLFNVSDGGCGPPVGQHFGDFLPDPQRVAFSNTVTDASPDKDKPPEFRCRVQVGSKTTNMTVSPLSVGEDVLGYMCQGTRKPRSSDMKLVNLMDHLDLGVWEYDTKTKDFEVSEAWLRMRGKTRKDEADAKGRDWLENVHPDDRDTMRRVSEGQAGGSAPTVNVQYRCKHKDGHWFWVLCRSKVMTVDADGMPLQIVGTDTDVTELRQNEVEMAQLAEQLRLAVDGAGIGIWEFDPNTGLVFWDDRMLEMYGLSDGNNVRCGELWETYLHPDDLKDTLAYSDHCQQNGLDFRRDYRVVHANGDIRNIRSRASHVAVPGRLPKLVGANIDITEDYQRARELERAKAQLLHDSRHDALTGLANRRLLDETAEAFFQTVGPTDRFAALHLDLDHFKRVNDTQGHAAGDAVLAHVAKTLVAIIGPSGLVSRMGGDEFTVFYEQAPSAQNLAAIATSIISALQHPILFEGKRCGVGVSIGSAIGVGPPASHSEVFVNADAALYLAKSAGRNCYRAYCPDAVRSLNTG